MSTRCHVFDAELRESATGAAVALSDAFAGHLDDCPKCRRAFDRGVVPLDPAVFERLDARARVRLVGFATRLRPDRRWLVAAAVAVVLLGFGALAVLRMTGPAPANVEVALVEDHIRYLGSQDRRDARGRQELARDLAAYVDFPFRLPAGEPASLTGARRCYLLGRRVVLAFYEESGVPVSYFVLPAEGLAAAGIACGDGELRCTSEHGFSVVTWRRAGLLHGVVAADESIASSFATRIFSADSRPGLSHLAP